MLVADAEGAPRLDAQLGDSASAWRRITVEQALALVPILRPEWLAAAALDESGCDMEVAAIHQGFLRLARQAGAQLVLVYNNTNQPIEQMGTKSISIPAVFISQQMGQKLIDMLNQGQEIRVQFRPEPFFEFSIPQSILLEHVSCRVLSDHIRRGDLYLNLVSPSGTRSELQRPNGDYSQGPDNWPFFSTQFFYEPGAGTWRFYINDLQQGATGSVLSCELTLYGMPITDEDRDGLEDEWERKYFGNLVLWFKR